MKPVYSYYLTQRPPAIGTHPTEGLEFIDENVERRYIPEIMHEAYARLTYGRELTEKEISDYELIPCVYMVRLTRQDIFLIKDMCVNAATQCPEMSEVCRLLHRKMNDALEEG